MAQDTQHASPASPESPRNGEPPLPQSPDSLSQGEVLERHHPNTVTTDTSHRIHPATLHLKPVTWESLAGITLPSAERFEVVDGLLVWIPMGNGTQKHQRVYRTLTEFINLLTKWRAASGVDVEVESISGNTSDANSRTPDIIVTAERPGSPSASSSSSERTPKKLVILTRDKPAYALIEVTSKSTRTTDLTEKWVQYCHTGTNFYYIIDLHGREVFNVERVIVGSKARIPGWTRCNSGDPDGASSSAARNTNTHRGFYYKKVYTGYERVNVGIFQDSPLTASQLMSLTFLNQKVAEIKRQNRARDGRIENLSRQNQDLSRQSEEKDGRIEDLSRQSEEKDGRIEDLSRQGEEKDGRIEDLSRENESYKQEIMRLRALHAGSGGSPSKYQPDEGPMQKHNKPSSSSHRQLTQSPPASPTKSPTKKRAKRRK